VAVVEHRRHKAEADSAALTDLIRLANAHLSRLARVDHYCDRIGELEAALVEKDVTGAAILEGDLVPNAQASTGAQNKAEVERRMLEIERFASAGRLAATIAHEVNNPMEAIKNAVYLLAGSVPESALPVYNILKSETERVARVVRQMLGLYRHTEPVKPVSVNTIIEDTLLLLGRQLQLAGVQVEIDLGLLADAFIAPDQIRQVLYNLVINARDAMPNGGRLRIRSRHVIARDQASNWIRILVADTGAGIPREIIPDIFEPFVTTKGELGTGLGLWIVKGIIQSHTGTITVRSKVGRGTVFRIDLPIAKP
jgi:signal transduction histidine kinase